MKMKRSFFSMIELLTVIAIIAVLAGIAMPVYSNVRAKARNMQAQADCRAIATAIAKMKATYGKMTGTTSDTSKYQVNSNGRITNLDDYIRRELCSPGTETANTPLLNGRRIVFLDSKNKGADDTWRDPWGHEYLVYIDKNYSNKITTISGHSSSSAPLRGPVFVFSMGPDGQTGSAATCKDDVKSW